mgnify:CR=1 FL=1
MVDEGMAKLSLELAYSAMAVYTAAFIGYAVAAAAAAGAATGAGAADAPQAESKPADDNVVDAEFKEVKK